MSGETFHVCFFFRRKFKVRVAETPVEIKKLFDDYADNGVMNVDHLKKFLIEYQGEMEVTNEKAQSIIDNYKHHNIFQKKGLNLEGFIRFLFSNDNPPVLPEVHHDMNAPLSHYLIYTGHNSYLGGNQLTGDCSHKPIETALKRGVKVIELDLWPNSSRNDVEVLHGRTLTKPVGLAECLTCIKKHAFSVSEYPVVITLEDHLAPDLQTKVAKLITDTFGDMLLDRKSFERFKELPSPEKLKRKIIISTKPPKNKKCVTETKSSNGKISGIEESPEDVSGKGCMGKYMLSFLKVRKARENRKGKTLDEEDQWGKDFSEIYSQFNATDKDDEECNDGLSDEDLDAQDKKQKPHVSPLAYEHIIAIPAGKHKNGIRDSLRIDSDKIRRISLSEPALENAVKKHGKDVVRFTQKNLLRVYPKGTRVNSSNYKPLMGWIHGAQMVAFNMQGYGRSLWLMHGMFRANGGCGYVKKPDILLRGDPYVFDRKAKLQVKKILKVRVYMGEGWKEDFNPTHFDTYSPPDFYTRVGIAGVPADSGMNKTGIIANNWTPVWDKEFEYPLTVPELALLRIEVHEYDNHGKDDFAGQASFPVSELREGIRAVPLYSHKLVKYENVKILMRFELVTV